MFRNAENEPAAGQYKAGTYTASAQGNNGPVELEVTFTADAITSVVVKSQQETEAIASAPLTSIPQAIVDGQTLAVDVVSGATHTSEAILAAAEDCVAQAGGDVEALKTAGNKTAAERRLKPWIPIWSSSEAEPRAWLRQSGLRN